MAVNRKHWYSPIEAASKTAPSNTPLEWHFQKYTAAVANSKENISLSKS